MTTSARGRRAAVSHRQRDTAGATVEDVAVGSLRLHVRRSGDGPPLLLINGIGASLDMWKPLAPQLPGHEVIAFDMPGCGHSAPLPRPVRMRGLADIVDGLLEALGHQRAHVLGYSLGGLVAQELAYRHPERVDRLVLCATTPGTPSVPPNPLALWSTLAPARQLRSFGADRLVSPKVSARMRRDTRVLLGHIGRSSSRPQLHGYAHQLYALCGWSSHLWLWRLRQPTLILHGADDPFVPLLNARYMAAAIPAARLHVIPGAGHLMLLERAPAAGRPIREFLDA